MQDFHQLQVWQRAHALVLRVYALSAALPASENFGLILNLRRSAVSIARSIAEGAGRDSDAEFAQELKRARASGHDLEYILLLCRDLHLIKTAEQGELTAEIIAVRKMISGLLKKMS